MEALRNNFFARRRTSAANDRELFERNVNSTLSMETPCLPASDFAISAMSASRSEGEAEISM
jgi:hypothetical protein